MVNHRDTVIIPPAPAGSPADDASGGKGENLGKDAFKDNGCRREWFERRHLSLPIGTGDRDGTQS
jgi:hypothetical protein